MANDTATLTWNANVEPDFKEYWVFRKVNTAPETQIATIQKGTQTYVDTPLPAIDGTLAYNLLAVDTAGNKSAHSFDVVKPINAVPPQAPTGLVVVIS